MSGYIIQNQNKLYYMTCTVVSWVDVFTRKKYCDTILESLSFCQEHKGLNLHAYVIMSHHIHIIVSAKEGRALSHIIRDFKKHTSKSILKQIAEDSGESRQEWMMRIFKYHAKYNQNNTTYQFWQRGNHPIELISPKWILQKLNYIHNNPVKAGIVHQPEHYVFSSASNYLGQDVALSVQVLDLGVTDGYIHL